MEQEGNFKILEDCPFEENIQEQFSALKLEQNEMKESGFYGKDDKFNSSCSSIANKSEEASPVILSMLEKLEKNSPFNLFFNKLPNSEPTLSHENSVAFTDLLCPSLGELKCSLQLNFDVDIDWLMEQYNAQGQGEKPLDLVYGCDMEEMDAISISRKYPNVTSYFYEIEDPFGLHHSKLSIFGYEDNSIRIVVSTANLYTEDWELFNNGLWISPRLPKQPEGKTEYDGLGPTKFKKDLLDYLNSYKLQLLNNWIDMIKQADFSAVRVFLVTSIPGIHYPNKNGNHAHRVGELLSQYCKLPSQTTPESEGPLSWGIIAQASSIGSFGKSPAVWLRGFLLNSLAKYKQGPKRADSKTILNIVYPSVDNVMESICGEGGVVCLPYSKDVHKKQKWIRNYLCQWKADQLHRSRNMPHIKTYCRISPCLTKLAYFLLTSANVSRGAWGSYMQKDRGIYNRSYEVGIMFLPMFFDRDFFCIRPDCGDEKIFPMIYDVPLTHYSNDDSPFCT